MSSLLTILGGERYMPLSVCMTEDPVIMTMSIASNALAVAAYVVMAVVMLVRYRTVRRSPAMDRISIMPLFAAMLLLSAFGGLSEISTIFWGVYRLDVFITAALAGIAVCAAGFTLADYVKDVLGSAEG